MNEYYIKLQHDKGVVTILTSATDIYKAIKQVLSSENAPEESIINITPVHKK